MLFEIADRRYPPDSFSFISLPPSVPRNPCGPDRPLIEKLVNLATRLHAGIRVALLTQMLSPTANWVYWPRRSGPRRCHRRRRELRFGYDSKRSGETLAAVL